MLNKFFPFLLIRIRIKKPFFRLSIPVAVFVFTGLLDCALDILDTVKILTSRSQDQKEGKIVPLIIMLKTFRFILSDIGIGENFDLVNVETNQVSIRIKVR